MSARIRTAAVRARGARALTLRLAQRRHATDSRQSCRSGGRGLGARVGGQSGSTNGNAPPVSVSEKRDTQSAHVETLSPHL